MRGVNFEILLGEGTEESPHHHPEVIRIRGEIFDLIAEPMGPGGRPEYHDSESFGHATSRWIEDCEPVEFEKTVNEETISWDFNKHDGEKTEFQLIMRDLLNFIEGWDVVHSGSPSVCQCGGSGMALPVFGYRGRVGKFFESIGGAYGCTWGNYFQMGLDGDFSSFKA